MNSVNIGEVKVFKGVEPSKEYALKALEEAAEVYGAWQNWSSDIMNRDTKALIKQELLNECADVIQATCNLISALGMEDFSEYMEVCQKRNERRGRY